jgi:DNA-binding MarR family transcriptional regulator
MNDDPDLAAFADLADLILNVGRLIRARTPTGAELVALTDTERQVMRIIDLYPGCAPSTIAERSRLQRTNVSTALRSLEGKGMIVRTTASRRGVAVTATELAATNLRNLRSAWSQQLGNDLRDDLDAVRDCNRLLSRLERRLTDNEDRLGS